jgi:putative ABC transport system substrate-binding protein
VILAAALDVAVATQRITATVPIVVVDATYEGRDRVVESLTRPGGNVTGIGNIGPTTSQKRLALLKKALPRAVQVAVLTRPSHRHKRGQRMLRPSPQAPRAPT